MAPKPPVDFKELRPRPRAAIGNNTHDEPLGKVKIKRKGAWTTGGASRQPTNLEAAREARLGFDEWEGDRPRSTLPWIGAHPQFAQGEGRASR